jgi:hypothetical protein
MWLHTDQMYAPDAVSRLTHRCVAFYSASPGHVAHDVLRCSREGSAATARVGADADADADDGELGRVDQPVQSMPTATPNHNLYPHLRAVGQADRCGRREEAELPNTRVAADGVARATVDAQQQASIPGGSWGAGLEPSGPANGTASRALEAKQEECDQLAHELARTRSASCVAWGSIHGPSMGHPLGAIHGPPSGGSGGSSYSRMRACVHAHKIRTPPPHRSSGLESAERENAVLRSAAVHRDRSASSVVACMARIKADEEPLVGL